MKNRSIHVLALFLTGIVTGCSTAPEVGDALPSWNDGATKAAIVDFVDAVTEPDSPDFVPAAERIAVFDNDGTLWIEQPMYTQLAFAIDRIPELAPDHPEWQETEPFRSILAGDAGALKQIGVPEIVALVTATHGNLTTDEFAAVTKGWLATALHPRFDRPYTELTYRPMLELLEYLRAHGFRTWIVSGGGTGFMRPWAERVYGIPPEQVVGTRIAMRYEMRNGVPIIMRDPEITFVDDKDGKPIAIQQATGRRPIAAFGNSDGDFEMLEWTTSGKGRRLGVLIHHDDAEREYAYDRESHIGRLDRGLDEASDRGWTVVSMRSDWREVFAPRDWPESR